MKHSHTYIISVEGCLDESWSGWFEGMRVVNTASLPGTSALIGSVRDQAELYGHLVKIRDLSLTLVSVQRFDGHEVCTDVIGKANGRN